MKTFHLKMTTVQLVELSVTNNSLSEEYSHPDDHTRQTTDTPGFKPFTTFIRWQPRQEKWANGIFAQRNIH